ncbi:MAG: carbamoyl-phosphate synthase large subunit [Armatimonadetes bacterium]|nr:carbamoyl-phosphate synthase large subunit [Armatimonadota bacterium]
MPKRNDIHKILVIGSGPIVIGQACEFDYSGTQAVKALKDEGFHVILVNSNPATIMTDLDVANETFLEPLTSEVVAQIIEKTRPDALLPTMGGQTALNIAVELSRTGVLEKYGVELLGADLAAIEKAEDRGKFRAAASLIGLAVPRSALVENLQEASHAAGEIGFPLILRPAFTLGGMGGGFVMRESELSEKVGAALRESLIHQVLMEESLWGWKEYELEVMQDSRGNAVIVCSIENLDPMGVHTGDSITVAPAQTLTDREYQTMRRMAFDIMREIGIATGGANVQFAVNPRDGRIVLIEMNPRVSRSSALASKATGFPIAKIAALVSVGLTLDEIPNDITRLTPASFEPVIDYVVTKIPRFAEDKFEEADHILGTSMQSVGEVMAIGRTFPESLQKALRSLERGFSGLDESLRSQWEAAVDKKAALRVPTAQRIFYLKYALADGRPEETLEALCGVDRWFLAQIRRLVQMEQRLREARNLDARLLREAKELGFSDKQICLLCDLNEDYLRMKRHSLDIRPAFLAVDTCAAEFPAFTPYYYSAYELSDDLPPSAGESVVILGSGPNRLGQGTELAAFALKELGLEAVMVNSNPETVSTDYDTSTRLYFEPLTSEDILEILHREKPRGVILQLGGQTPLKLARTLTSEGIRILGTSFDSIDQAESRERFALLSQGLGLQTPPFGTADTVQEALREAGRLGYPVLVRPSYVLSGSAMRIIYDEEAMSRHAPWAFSVSDGRTLYVDKFLEDALEIDVDALSDGKETWILGIMEHIEEAGIHSGDSACLIPPRSLRTETISQIEEDIALLARELRVIGFLNVQFALRGNRLFVLEVNPRASRTIPYICKAQGLPFVKAAVAVMLGASLSELEMRVPDRPPLCAVKVPVLPFKRFGGVDAVLGPEMKSTGEVIGLDDDFGAAYWKALSAAGQALPTQGAVFLSVKDEDKRGIVPVARKLLDFGFSLLATRGTALVLERSGISVVTVEKVQEGSPNVVDYIQGGRVQLIINTPSGAERKRAGFLIRRAAITRDIPLVTTITGAHAVISAMEEHRRRPLKVRSLQEYHGCATETQKTRKECKLTPDR